MAAGAAGRLAALLHGLAAPPARRDGLGVELRVRPMAVAAATVLAAVIAVVATGPVRAALALGVCALVSAASVVLARLAVGGSTGDTAGAAVASTEVLVCLALLATWR